MIVKATMGVVEPEISIDIKDSESIIKTLKRRRDRKQKNQNHGRTLRRVGVPVTLAAGAVGAWGFLESADPAFLGGSYSAISLATGTGSAVSIRNHFSRNRELDSLNQDIEDTYLFEEDTDFSELFSVSDELEFQDFYFETEEQNLYSFQETEAAGFYSALLREPFETGQYLTVKQEEDRTGYILDVELGEDLAGRFKGDTEEDIEHLLEEGVPGEEFSDYVRYY